MQFLWNLLIDFLYLAVPTEQNSYELTVWSGSCSCDLIYNLRYVEIRKPWRRVRRIPLLFHSAMMIFHRSAESSQCATATRRDSVCVFQFRYPLSGVRKRRNTKVQYFVRYKLSFLDYLIRKIMKNYLSLDNLRKNSTIITNAP